MRVRFHNQAVELLEKLDEKDKERMRLKIKPLVSTSETAGSRVSDSGKPAVKYDLLYGGRRIIFKLLFQRTPGRRRSPGLPPSR